MPDFKDLTPAQREQWLEAEIERLGRAFRAVRDQRRYGVRFTPEAQAEDAKAIEAIVETPEVVTVTETRREYNVTAITIDERGDEVRRVSRTSDKPIDTESVIAQAREPEPVDIEGDVIR